MPWPKILDKQTDHQHSITLHGKPVEVTWTKAVDRELAKRNEPLIIEMMLNFSCFIRKEMRFHDGSSQENVHMVTDKLGIYFHSVVSGHCLTDSNSQQAAKEELSVDRSRAFIPKWIRIEYQNGEWTGSYGS